MRGSSNYEISERSDRDGRPSPAIPSHPHYSRSLHSTDSNRTLLGCVPEEREFIMDDVPCDTESAKWDKELERQGLFRGTYSSFPLCIYAVSS